MRAIWTGEIAFGLVNIPVKLYTATRDLTPQFTTLHKECGSKVKMVRRCPVCRRDVELGELGKGYEVQPGTYALFTKEELAELDGGGPGSTVEIVEFVEPGAVDLAYIDKSYWVGAGGKNSRGFSLLREALVESNRVALAKTKLRSRTRLALLRPRGKLFALEMMRYADEIVDSAQIDVPDTKPATPRELELARDLIRALEGPFDPTKVPDQYRAAVEAAVEAKTASSSLTKAPAVEGTAEAGGATEGKVIDLAELLARSLNKAEPKGEAKSEPAAPEDAHAKPGPKKTGTKDAKKRAAS